MLRIKVFRESTKISLRTLIKLRMYFGYLILRLWERVCKYSIMQFPLK